MKTVLFDFETRLMADELEEAMDLVRETHEYDLTPTGEGRFHCLSKQPDYHVELRLLPEGMVSAKCHCAVFKKSKQCKHAIAALFLIRTHLLRDKKAKTKLVYDPVDDVVRKLKPQQLRSFIAGYARSHSTFRSELLAQYLHLLRKPDYQRLLAETTPIDKYGQIKVNRNNLKSIRNIIAVLLRQAQMTLEEKAPAMALQILSATLRHLYRLASKLPQFTDQLMTELRLAHKLFGILCTQPMAPRLQKEAIELALDISGRDDYASIRGVTSLLEAVAPFLLENKLRVAAFRLAERRVLPEGVNQSGWAALMLQWMRLWNTAPLQKEVMPVLEKNIPESIREFARMSRDEDVLFALTLLQRNHHDPTVIRHALVSGMRAAQQSGQQEKLLSLAFELSLHYLDVAAWDELSAADPDRALRALRTLEENYSPGADPEAERLLLHGWSTLGMKDKLLERLRHTENIERLMQYDLWLIQTHREALTDTYAGYIHGIREAYGGVVARQKLSNIFGHLKSIQLYADVMDTLKQMDNKKSPDPALPVTTIQGFVFDLDGVIVDTAVHHFQSWKQILKQLGADIADEDDHHTRGASRMESLDYLLRRYGIELQQEEKERWAALKNEVYLEAIESITPADLLPGVLRFLQASKDAGLRVALGSASKNAKSVLKKLDVESFFDAVLDGHDAQASKPDPEIFIKACQALELDPASVIVFEDAAKGVRAAIDAGCKVVGIGEPSNLPEADIVIQGLDQSTPSRVIELLQ